MDLTQLQHIHADIEAVYEEVRTYRVRVDGLLFGIRILQSAKGRYIYELSHQYRGSDAHDHSYDPSSDAYETIEEAAEAALRRLTFGYRSTDEGGHWEPNEHFGV